jgi:hypothetical protein
MAFDDVAVLLTPYENLHQQRAAGGAADGGGRVGRGGLPARGLFGECQPDHRRAG